MDCIKEKFNAKKVVLGSTTLFNGLVAGGLCFVSGVDVACVKKLYKDPSTLISYTNAWWPCGKNYMVKMLPITCCLNLAASYITKDYLYLGTGLLIASIGVFTKTVMTESIDSLTGTVADTNLVDDFCFYHHFRAMFALTATALVIMKNFEGSE